MNMPFHYYGTYCAAIQAGFSTDAAQVIADIAQFVDECDERWVKGTGYLPTVQSNWQLIKKNLSLPDAPVPDEVVKVWMSFHFLPGNLNIENRVRLEPRTIPFSSIEAVEFHKLMCLPYSPLVGAMIDNVKTIFDSPQLSPEKKLVSIGIAMHVLADTFAHQYFVGTPSRDINEVGQVQIFNPMEDTFERSKWFPAVGVMGRIAYSPAFSDTSIGWLGHARIGVLPDLPGKKYLYSPNWDKEAGYYKNNPLVHLLAYQQMVDALTYINTANVTVPFDYAREMTEAEYMGEVNQAILEIFNQPDSSDEGQSTAWCRYIGTLSDGQGNPVPYPLHEMEQMKVLKNEFLRCAREHMDMVCVYCERVTNGHLSRYFN